MNQIDLKALLLLLWKRVWWLLLGLAVGLITAFFYTRFMVTPKYTSYIQLYCVNSPVISSSSSISSSDLTSSRMLVETYSIVLKSDEVLGQVAELLGGNLTAGSLRGMVTINSVNETEVMQVTAVTKDPRLSEEVCACIAEVAPDSLKRIMHVGAVEQIGVPTKPTSPSSPSYQRNMMLGAIVGLLVVAAVILLKYFLDNTVLDEKELQNRLDIPVLGEVPAFTTGDSRKKHYGYGYGRSK